MEIVHIFVQVVKRLPRDFRLSHQSKIVIRLIILLPVLFSALLKAYIQSGSDEILELYFPFCHMLSWLEGSVVNSDDDREVSGICLSAFY